MGHDLVVLGDLVADLIVPVERLPLLPDNHGWAEGIFLEPGGAGNVLVAARRLNLDVAALGQVGSDQYGAATLAMLEPEGVDLRHVAVYPDRSTVLCIVLADRLNQHVYLGIKDDLGVWPFPETWHAVIRQSRALYTDGYTMRDLLAPEDVFAAFATARAGGVPIFFDPGPSAEFIPDEQRQWALAATDVLLLSEAEAWLLSPLRDRVELAKALLAFGPSVVVLKLGGEGCLVATSEEVQQVAGFSVPVVDTVGAGDSFAPAFIAGWLRGGTLRDCAVLGNAMGALAVTQRGAGTRIPHRAQLLELLADHPAARALVG
ncbi:MAG TPA: carbohydrate kinase family protein [Thermomicrobiales bacterium]|nr:carbohydrate kinase family protein [Thermomicrobiales bacterium]